MPLPETVNATVSPSIIGRVGRLFNGSAADVLAELLQNARRAGATRVGVSVLDLDGRRTLAVVDNGRGIDDPAALLSLGHSGWDGATAISEDPAGMGFFSLAGRRVEVRSRSQALGAGWRMVIEPSAWQSAEPVPVAPFGIAGGTEILIDLPAEWEPEVDRTVRGAARHYPLPVLFQGVECERSDWLSDAVHVEDWCGSRIGVILGASPSSYQPTLNFHGVTVPLRLPYLAEEQPGRSWHVRVDIGDTPELQLVLPARKEVVQSPFLAALKKACEAAIYRAVAASGAHRLPYEHYARSYALGVPLAEATPALSRWQPATADWIDARGGLIEGPMIRMGAIEPALGQTAARALALARRDDLLLAAEEPGFDGYRWYDALERVTDLRLRIARDGVEQVIREGDRVELTSGRAERIAVELAIGGPAGAERCVTLASDVALVVADEYLSDLDAVALIVTPEPAIDVGALVDLLVDAAFSPSDDRDADSYDTQREWFEREALQLARTHLIGADAALIGRALDRASDHIRWLVPAGRTLVMAITREGVQAMFRDAPLAVAAETAFLVEIERLADRGEAADAALGAIRVACAVRRRELLAQIAAVETAPPGDGG